MLKIEIRSMKHRAQYRDFVCAVASHGKAIASRLLGETLTATERYERVAQFAAKWSHIVDKSIVIETPCLVVRCEAIFL